MPFKLIRYDNKRLMRVIAIIQELDISEVMKGWIDGYPKYVYPEVHELYKLHPKNLDLFTPTVILMPLKFLKLKNRY